MKKNDKEKLFKGLILVAFTYLISVKALLYILYSHTILYSVKIEISRNGNMGSTLSFFNEYIGIDIGKDRVFF